MIFFRNIFLGKSDNYIYIEEKNKECRKRVSNPHNLLPLDMPKEAYTKRPKHHHTGCTELNKRHVKKTGPKDKQQQQNTKQRACTPIQNHQTGLKQTVLAAGLKTPQPAQKQAPRPAPTQKARTPSPKTGKTCTDSVTKQFHTKHCLGVHGATSTAAAQEHQTPLHKKSSNVGGTPQTAIDW